MEKICPECDGKKVMVYSCCTGDPVYSESMMCPVCHEHLGEEDCFTCEGKGWVKETPADLQKQDLAHEAAEIKAEESSNKKQ